MFQTVNDELQFEERELMERAAEEEIEINCFGGGYVTPLAARLSFDANDSALVRLIFLVSGTSESLQFDPLLRREDQRYLVEDYS